MLGGLAPGTGRSLNALIKMRAVTGVTRAFPDRSPVFKPGQILDELLSASGGAVTLSFTYPSEWTVAGGPNLDVRDVKAGDSAFVLVTELPAGKRFEDLKDSFFLDLIFDPAGKYGQYGAVEDRKVAPTPATQDTMPVLKAIETVELNVFGAQTSVYYTMRRRATGDTLRVSMLLSVLHNREK